MPIQVPLTATLGPKFPMPTYHRMKMCVMAAFTTIPHTSLQFDETRDDRARGLSFSVSFKNLTSSIRLVHHELGHRVEFSDPHTCCLIPTDLDKLMVEIPDDMAHLFPNAVPVPTSYTLAELVATRYELADYDRVTRAIVAKLAVKELVRPGFKYRLNGPTYLAASDWYAINIWVGWVENGTQSSMTLVGGTDRFLGVEGDAPRRMPNWLFHMLFEIPGGIDLLRCGTGKFE